MKSSSILPINVDKEIKLFIVEIGIMVQLDAMANHSINL